MFFACYIQVWNVSKIFHATLDAILQQNNSQFVAIHKLILANEVKLGGN